MGITVEENKIAVPGELLAEGMDYLPGQNTYRDGEKIFASRVGLVKVDGRVLKLIQLEGKYVPKRNDVIIGKVYDILMSGWRIDTNSVYSSMLSLKEGVASFVEKGADLTRYYSIGDYLVCKITNVTTQKLVDVSTRGPGLRKLSGGRIINVSPKKVPRIIGKKGSMVSMIKQATDTKIIVGQNGIIWIDGINPELEIVATKTIDFIQRNAHVSGLTDIVKEKLEKETGRKIGVIEESTDAGDDQ